MAASTGNEETLFLRGLQKTIFEIPQLARWDPKVVVRNTLEEVLDEKVKSLLIGIYGASIDDDPHAFGLTGQMALNVFIAAIVFDTRGGSGSVPAVLAGEVTSVGPSLSIVDGALRNALDATTLDGFIPAGMCEIEGGDPLPISLPTGAAARLYIFTAYKEVER